MAVRLGDVFVAGGLPEVTYIPRESFSLEGTFRDYLDDGHHLICVTGPTKSGKTVLCRTVLKDSHPIWLDGGSISSEDDFWDQLADRVEAVESEENLEAQTREDSTTATAQGGVNLGVASVGGGGTAENRTGSVRARTRRIARSKKAQALDLLRQSGSTLVVDDFHYLSRELQTTVVKALKAPIFDGLRVVVLSVPHRAYDAVRVEREMTGRVKQVEIPEWTSPELQAIATKGFAALNVGVADRIVGRLVAEAWENPHLMQTFCNKLCRSNEVRDRQLVSRRLTVSDIDFFFEEMAKDTGRKEFDRLARGPRQRSDRMVRKFKDGSEGDIYLLVLKALAATGPKSEVLYEDFRTKVSSVLLETTIQKHEISRVLIKMSEPQEGADYGAPPVDWDAEEQRIHVIDPFFAFYLKWGAFRPEK